MLAENVERRDCTIRDALRFDTRDVHQQLHEHALFVALFDGTIDPSQYSALMRSFHGFYAPLEQAINRAFAQIGATEHGFRYINRMAYLVGDLADLGHSPADIENNPLCQEILDTVTPASLGGVLYVIEGSTLGAAQIDRAAQKILEQDTTKGRSFWAWSRAQNKHRWAAINDYLQHLESMGHPKAPIIQGANDTFQALATWLAPLDQPVQTAESASA